MISATETARAELIRIEDTGPDFVPADYHVEKMRAVLDQIDALVIRRDQLLQVIANISQSTPLDSEVSEALEQRGKLLAEIGTLRAQRDAANRDRVQLLMYGLHWFRVAAELIEYKAAVQAEAMAAALFGDR